MEISYSDWIQILIAFITFIGIIVSLIISIITLIQNRNILINSPLLKNKEAIYKYNKDYDYLPKELEKHFDGKITILIVDKNYRGRKIGKNLLNQIFELASNDNMKNIQILSDESCNYKFYEKLGCKKIYEKTIQNGEPDKSGNISYEKGFIYEKIF